MTVHTTTSMPPAPEAALDIRVAGCVVRLQHRWDFVRDLCAAHAIPLTDAPDMVLSVTDTELELERAASDRPYPAGMLESTCLHRALCAGLSERDVFLIHSAVVALDGLGYAFLAPSGVGKSTHIRHWIRYFGDRAWVVNGDKPFYTFQGSLPTVCGSPWRGKEGWGVNRSVALRALCILTRGEENRIRRASAAEAVPHILGQVLLPSDMAGQVRLVAFLDRLLAACPVYYLQCTPEEEAAVVASAAMAPPPGERGATQP